MIIVLVKQFVLLQCFFFSFFPMHLCDSKCKEWEVQNAGGGKRQTPYAKFGDYAFNLLKNKIWDGGVWGTVCWAD